MDVLGQEWNRLGLPARAAAVLDELRRRYGETHRHYHNLEHLAQVLAVISRLEARLIDPLAVRLAAWFHDAVYDSRAADNEERSAELAGQLLTPWTPEGVKRIQDLILCTKTHQADDADAAVLLDADLAIPGAEPSEYDRYAQAIRLEYSWVEQEAYRQGRARVLDNFLGRERIYRTPELHLEREGQARQNLSRELAELRSG